MWYPSLWDLSKQSNQYPVRDTTGLTCSNGSLRLINIGGMCGRQKNQTMIEASRAKMLHPCLNYLI